jgi:transcriptional regulator with XRE-family HTH domain
MDLGAIVAEARRHRQWTQAELAVRARVSRQWIGALESGQAVRAELGRVLAVVVALDLQMTLAVPLSSRDRAARTTLASVRSSDAPVEITDITPGSLVDLDAHLESYLSGDTL